MQTAQIKMQALEKTQITIGFMPLLDSAPMIWAWHRGFFKQFGLDVTLAQEVSWASLRDRLAYGALDAAQCLAPMILAANLGADQVGVPFVSALTLSENWAAISLSSQLAQQLNMDYQHNTPRENAQALQQIIQQGRTLRLAHVFQFSLHHYLLREWLSLAELNEKSIEFCTVPPSQMVDQLQAGRIDGFCVGEPWNTAAVSSGIGKVVTNAQAIWPHGADKVLGVTQYWAQQNPNTHRALVAAILKAQYELATQMHYAELINILEQLNVLQLPESWLNAALDGFSAGNPARFLTGLHARPKPADYAWISLQIIRWQQWQQPVDLASLSQQACDIACFDAAYQLLSQQENLPEQLSLSSLQKHAIDTRQAVHYLISKGWTREQAQYMLVSS